MSETVGKTAYQQGREDGIRQAVTWLRADYPYGTGPDWREQGAEWIEDRAAEERIAATSENAASQEVDRG